MQNEKEGAREFFITEELLGKGTYSNVFLAKTGGGKEVAVKCCPIGKNGIPNITELSIMSSILHPFLCNAINIFSSHSKLYIIQDLAITDLARYTRIDRENRKPELRTLYTWCFCISSAVDALHEQKIIHADIKASNVLLYDTGVVKLADFSLSAKTWDKKSQHLRTVCTCTHRPLECLLGESWDESLDIWSLGCTFYEIAYGELLFPYQGTREKREHDPLWKKEITEKSAQAILDCSERGPPKRKIVNVGFRPRDDFIPFRFCEEYEDLEMNLFNDLLCKMLVVPPSDRIDTKEILSHPIFRNKTPPGYTLLKRPPNKLPIAEIRKISSIIKKLTPDKPIQSLSLDIYQRCNNLGSLGEFKMVCTCVWIASKMILGDPPVHENPFYFDKMLTSEREICHNLSFMIGI